jgi:hypothetical protein
VIYDKRPNLTLVNEALNNEFESEFAIFGGQFDAGSTSTQVGAEIIFDGPKGPAWYWYARVQYAEASTPTGLGPFRLVRPLEEAVDMLKQEIREFRRHMLPIVSATTWGRRQTLSGEDRERLIGELNLARASGDSARADVFAAGLRIFGVSFDD